MIVPENINFTEGNLKDYVPTRRGSNNTFIKLQQPYEIRGKVYKERERPQQSMEKFKIYLLEI